MIIPVNQNDNNYLWVVALQACWEIILHVSLARLHILQAEALISSVLNCLFQDTCIKNSLGGQRQYVPQEQKAGLFTIQDKNVSFYGKGQVDLLRIIKDLGFLSYNATQCICSCHPALFHIPLVRNEARNRHKGSYSGYCYCYV